MSSATKVTSTLAEVNLVHNQVASTVLAAKLYSACGAMEKHLFHLKLFDDTLWGTVAERQVERETQILI